MPMTGAGLKAAIDAVSFDEPEISADETGEEYRMRLLSLEDGNREKLLDALIDYIKANATVTGTCPAGGGPLTLGRVT